MTVSMRMQGHVGVIELGSPPSNFIDAAVLGEVADHLERLGDDPSCRAIVLASQGRHFCAGADLNVGGMADDRETASRDIYRQAVRIAAARRPVVAAVQGAAVGGGLGLACVADFRVAAPTSRFHANFSRLGFHHGFGLTVTLPRIVGAQPALAMLLSGEPVSGEEARATGLVDRLVPDGTVREAALDLAQVLASRAPLAVASMRRTLRGDLAGAMEAALEHEHREQVRLWETEDCAEGIAAVAARREPVFRGV